MAELADALVLGTSGQPCRFKSCYPQAKDVEESASFFYICLRVKKEAIRVVEHLLHISQLPGNYCNVEINYSG